MKKLLLLAAVAVTTTVATGCSFGEKFYITNWGEYISDDLLEEFGELHGVKVVQTELISNELMYADLKQNSYQCDVVFPSDYMVEKLSKEGLIEKLDFSKLDNYTSTSMYADGLDSLIRNCGYSDYFIPYFWGSLGIMYNTTDAGVEDTVTSLGWASLFDSTALSKYDVAMYDSSRDSFAAAAMHLYDQGDSSYSINNYSTAQLDACASLLKSAKYHTWGDDNIKGSIASNNVQYGLVYSGDFFDQLYADDYSNDSYDIYIPDTNNVFFDAMCIPVNSQNKDLAYEFINFMMDHDNAVENALEVGYAPTIQAVLKEVLEDEDMADVVAYKAWNPQNLLNRDNSYAVVYKDLGDTYDAMETKFTEVRVG